MSAQYEVADAPSDIISSLAYSPSGAKLIVSSWDRKLYIYTRSESPDTPFSLDKTIEHRAPILDCTFGEDDDTAFTVGLDHDVRRISLDTDEQTVLSTHDAASNKVAYWREGGVVISTSWAGTMHVHVPSSGVWARIQLPAKPFALSLSSARAVVSMADRKVNVYDLQALKTLAEQAGPESGEQGDREKEAIHVEPWQTRESSLKFMTRAVACMPDGTGFAVSSIEGRVGVEFFDPEREKDTYAFKCHRQTQQDENGTEVDVVYPVSALAFNAQHGSLATGGGDGVVALWDSQTKRSIRQYSKLPASVAALAFSPDSTLLAIAVSPGFEDSKEEEETDRSLVKLMIRHMSENEAKPRPPKTQKKGGT